MAPLKRLIPLRLKILKNTDADFGIIELHGEDFVERSPPAGIPPRLKSLQHDGILRPAR